MQLNDVIAKLKKKYAFLKISNSEFKKIATEEIKLSKTEYDGQTKYEEYMYFKIRDKIESLIDKTKIKDYIESMLKDTSSIKKIENSMQKIADFSNELNIEMSPEQIGLLLKESKPFYDCIEQIFNYYKDFILNNKFSFITYNEFTISCIDVKRILTNIDLIENA